MNQGRGGIWLLFALILGSYFSSLDWGWGQEWKQSALLPLCSCVLTLGTELARDLDPASPGSLGACKGSPTPLPLAFCSFAPS